MFLQRQQRNKMAGKKQKSGKKPKGLNGWLIPVLFVFVWILINTFGFFIPRVIFLMNNISYGVIISSFILFISLSFVITGLYFMFRAKGGTVMICSFALVFTLIFSFWYHLLGFFLFYHGLDKFDLIIPNFIEFGFDAVIVAVILIYFKMSKRVKNTFVS